MAIEGCNLAQFLCFESQSDVLTVSHNIAVC